MAGTRVTDPGYSERPAHGRAFRIAMSVLGGIVSVQVLVVGHGIVRRSWEMPPAQADASAAPATAPSAALPAPALPVSVPAESDGSSSALPPASGPSVPAMPDGLRPVAPLAEAGDAAPVDLGAVDPVDPVAPAFVGPTEVAGAPGLPLFAALEEAARSRPLPDGILERLLVAGVELRRKGNMQGALKNFREVEAALPEDPRVLSEIAATVGAMGLRDRAAGYWERVEALGGLVAGPYPAIAKRELAEGAAAASESPALMRIGEVKVVDRPPTEEGQKVSLSVVIDADPAMHPVADDLSLIVNFYDRLPGGEVKPSTAETSFLYPTEPYDWRVDGTETIVVNYHQAAYSEEERRESPERIFHGYAIELYYRDELQDKVAMPEDIAQRCFEPVPAPAPAPAPGGISPENALFPDSSPQP